MQQEENIAMLEISGLHVLSSIAIFEKYGKFLQNCMRLSTELQHRL